MSAATKGRAPTALDPVTRYAMRLTARDLVVVRKQRDRQVTGGGAWQSWARILDILEAALLAQDAIEQETRALAEEDRATARLQDWLLTGGAV